MDMPGLENEPRRWVQQLGAARIAWSALTLAELRACKGDGNALTDLVRDRYGISRDAARHQVASFFARSRGFFSADLGE